MKNTPEIRFKGFTDAWVQRRLGEVAESFEYGLNAAATDFDGINKYIRITDIDDDSRMFKTESLTSPNCDLNLAKNYKLKNGNILFARTGASVGKTYLYRDIDGLVYFAGFLIRARINHDFDAEFVYQNTLTNNYMNFIKITSQRSGQPGINAQEYESYILYSPQIREQQILGNFFHTLDDTILLYKRKVENLKLLKKAYLQQMFPQEGEAVPKVRFAGFMGDWEKVKLGDVAEFKNGMNFSKEAMGHGFPFVNLQNIFSKTIVDISSLGLAESNEQQRKEYSLKKGDILFIRSSVRPEGVGEAAVIPCDLIDTTYSGFIIRCRIAGNFNDAFKQFLFGTEYFRCQMLNNATTSANTNINQDSLSKMLIKFPIKEEQTVIGNFFRNLDEQIATQKAKLDDLKKLKSAYLQKMFI